ncbi:hypothetical protein EVAR_100655_1 [Eumeta japonica]|uniref:Uncharacterized protein n=1 Tax=Eumeta variegata TaxID=151549 RepID=A0A4C1ZMR3_EUMVA|nr:hypothetical protein EVAR_100655_1 [Eumeta japonica]
MTDQNNTVANLTFYVIISAVEFVNLLFQILEQLLDEFFQPPAYGGLWRSSSSLSVPMLIRAPAPRLVSLSFPITELNSRPPPLFKDQFTPRPASRARAGRRVIGAGGDAGAR